MKVVAFWHGTLVKESHEYFRELAKIKDVELTLMVPECWPERIGGESLLRTLFGRYKKFYPEKTHDESYKIRIVRQFLPGKSIGYYRNLFKILNEEKPDIVHLIEESWTMVLAQVLMWRRLFSKKTKIIFTVYENLYRPHAKRPIYNLIHYKIIEDFNLRNADAGIGSYQEVIDVLRKKGFRKRTGIIGLGVDDKLFKKENSEKLKKELKLDKFVIGYSGRFTKDKGILTLMRAVSGLEDYQMLLLGWADDDFNEVMMREAEKLGIKDKMITVNERLGDRIVGYMNCMDVLIVPSETAKLWKEQFGRVIVEAHACKIPVIGSSSGSIPEVTGEGGLIFKEGDYLELREKINLLMKDEKLRKELAEKGYRRMKERYSWSKIAEQTYKFYKEVVF